MFAHQAKASDANRAYIYSVIHQRAASEAKSYAFRGRGDRVLHDSSRHLFPAGIAD